MKKILALLLAAVMMLSLGACGKFETKMATALEKMKDLDSVTIDTIVNIDANVDLGEGMAMPLTVKCTSTADVLAKPARGHVTMNIDVMGEEEKAMDMYMLANGKHVTVYASTDGETWEITESDVEDVEVPSFSLEQIVKLGKIADSFEEYKNELSTKNNCTIYQGKITGENIQDIINLAGVQEAYQETFESVIGDFDFSSMKEIPLTLVIDNDSEMVTQFTMDLTEWAQGVAEAALSTVAQFSEEADEEVAMSELNITVDNAKIVVNLKNFNEVPELEFPDVKNAEEPVEDVVPAADPIDEDVEWPEIPDSKTETKVIVNKDEESGIEVVIVQKMEDVSEENGSGDDVIDADEDISDGVANVQGIVSSGKDIDTDVGKKANESIESKIDAVTAVGGEDDQMAEDIEIVKNALKQDAKLNGSKLG
jgi:hypothetical protein